MAKNPTISQLDPGQIAKRVYDEANDRLRVDANITAPDGSSILIDATTDSIKIGNSATGPFLNVNPDGSINTTIGNISGDITPSGLHISGRIETFTIGDVAIPIPAVALANRNAFSVVNLSTSQTLYIGFSSSVTADRAIGSTAGWEVGPNEGFNLDVKDNIIIYAIAPTGMSILVKVMELA